MLIFSLLVLVEEVCTTERAESSASSETLSAKSGDAPVAADTKSDKSSDQPKSRQEVTATTAPTVVESQQTTSEANLTAEDKPVSDAKIDSARKPTIVRLDASGRITVVEQSEVKAVVPQDTSVPKSVESVSGDTQGLLSDELCIAANVGADCSYLYYCSFAVFCFIFTLLISAYPTLEFFRLY